MADDDNLVHARRLQYTFAPFFKGAAPAFAKEETVKGQTTKDGKMSIASNSLKMISR